MDFFGAGNPGRLLIDSSDKIHDIRNEKQSYIPPGEEYQANQVIKKYIGAFVTNQIKDKLLTG